MAITRYMSVLAPDYRLNQIGSIWGFLKLALQRCERQKKTTHNQMAVITAVTRVIRPNT